MKKFLSWLLAGAVLAPAVLSAASFEGKVNFKITTARDQPQEMRYSIKGGKENFRMEATAIEQQTLPATLFSPPADYQKLDMGGMMQGIPGLPGRRP